MRNFFVFQGGQKGADFYIYCERSLLQKIFKKFVLGGQNYPHVFSIYYEKEFFAKMFARMGDIYSLFFSMFIEGEIFLKQERGVTCFESARPIRAPEIKNRFLKFFRSGYLKKAAFFSIYYEQKNSSRTGLKITP